MDFERRKLRMIKYYINRWGFKKEDLLVKRPKAIYRDDPPLVELVRSLWKQNLSHDKILRALNEFEGYPNITDRQLKRLRLTHGLVYVNRGAAKLEQAQEDAYPLVHMELNAGQATRYGLVLSHTNIHLRSE